MHDLSKFSENNTARIDQISCKIPKLQTKQFPIELTDVSLKTCRSQNESDSYLHTKEDAERNIYQEKKIANACIHYREIKQLITEIKWITFVE